MAQVIIYQNPNGNNVCVCYPTGELPIEEVLSKDCPSGATIIDESELPQEENDFFDAWQQINGVITVNLNVAKEITKNRLRLERAPLLAFQDVLFQRALEKGSDITSIVYEKVRLRDITLLADNCISTSELRALKVV